MRALLRLLSLLLTCVALAAHADDAGPPQKEYLPKTFPGRACWRSRQLLHAG